jgi:hypothetical protein
MNPKMFALLLLIPMAVLATEKLTSTGLDGGGKEKRKPETTQSAAEKSETAVPVQETDAVQATSSETESKQTAAVASHETASEVTAPGPTKDALAEFKAMTEELENPESPYYSGKTYYIGEEIVPDDLADWLKKHVHEPLEKANPKGINLERSFSRCPSGYHVEIAGQDNVLTNEGWMVVDDGCWNRPVAKFRYDMAANKVEALAGETLGYIPLQDFFRLYAKVAKS